MSKRSPQTKQLSPPAKSINWLVIGGVVVVGVVSLFLLLILTVKPTPVLALPDYCQVYPDRCVSSGVEDAPVTILEVFDFGCPHCRDFHEETWSLLEQSYVAQAQVNWVVLPYALSADRIPAAASALCAQEQDAYFPYTKALFTGFDLADNLTVVGFQRAAAATNLNLNSFNQCLAEGRYQDVIRDNIEAASQIGVNSTPTFFINGQKLKGNLPLAQFQQQIENWLNR